MSHNLVFLAGSEALAVVRERGLRPEMVKVVAGAAGGPKGLVLSHLDRLIFSSWFRSRKEPLFLLGSSIGAWRFAVVAQNAPLEAIDRFQKTYIGQRYKSEPTPREVSMQALLLLNSFLDAKGVHEVLGHPYLRLSIMAARCKWPVASDNRVWLSLGLMDAALYNAVHRKGLEFFFERALFFDPRNIPPFFEMEGLPLNKIPLSAANMKYALLAAGSIPMLMSGVKNIPGAPKGVYRDSGVTDYHFDLSFVSDADGLVLFPHYSDQLIPSWFDRKLPWRKPHVSNLNRVVLVCPSRAFIEGLPHGKIPDRNDFRDFDDGERMAYRGQAVQMSECLGEEFLESVETGAIKDLVKPLS